MTYPCGCTRPWKSYDDYDPGELCPRHAAWCEAARKVEAAIRWMREDPILSALTEAPGGRDLITSLREVRRALLDLSTPEEPEGPDGEDDRKDRSAR